MKNFIFILMALFSISAMGSVMVPDDDVGDKVEVIDVQDVDQSVEVLTSVDFIATQTNIISLEQPGLYLRISEEDAALVLPTSRYINTLIDPGREGKPVSNKSKSTANLNGSSGGNPGWC